MKSPLVRKQLPFALAFGAMALPLVSAWAAVSASKELPDGEQFSEPDAVAYYRGEAVRVSGP